MSSYPYRYGAAAIGAWLALHAPAAFAHEAYVLTKEQFAEGMRYQGFDAMNALRSPTNVGIFLMISGFVLIALVANFLARHSRWGMAWNRTLERIGERGWGSLIVRVSIGVALLFSALTHSFLGPELPLTTLPLANILRDALFASSVMIILGIGTEIAAAVCLAVFCIAAAYFQWYLLTYLNYLGELAALLLFGSRKFSLDALLQGPLKRFPKLRTWETAIVRVCYGIALSYAAINIKFLHPHLTETVVTEYHLTQFHMLFPSDPLLVTFGAALAELTIGLFIILGFEIRLTVLISMFYITLSLLYFREAVWPHLLLYGISFNLLLASEAYTLDDFFDRHQLHLFHGKRTDCGCDQDVVRAAGY